MINALVYLGFGAERYRYPVNLPKVAATGGPQCQALADVPFDKAPKFVIADVGANPQEYGNQQLMLQLRCAQAVAVRTDRRAAAQRLPDWTTRMTGSRGMIIKFGAFALMMTMLTVSCSSSSASTEPVRRPSIRRSSAMFATERRADRCGSPVSGWARSKDISLRAGQEGRGEVRRRPQRRAHHRHPGRHPLPQPGW